MKSLLILAVVTVLAISLGVNHANAMCAIDTDWPNRPCIDTSPPLPLSKSEWRDLWSEYYTFKGDDWMKQQKLELDKQTKSDNLKEWIESGYDSQNFTNYNVWFYYYVNDQAPAPDGYGLDETSYVREILSPLKQFNSGIPIDKIQCKEGLELVIKSSNGSPACVKPETKTKLIEHGWASMLTLDPNTTEMPTNAKLMANATNTIFINVVGMDGVYRWYNDQEVNPTLTLWANVENTIQIHNPTDEKHEFVIESQSKEITTSGDILSYDNGNVTIKPNMEYTLEYHCKYHPDTMKGQIEIISP